MSHIERRNFLKLAGAVSAAAAVGGGLTTAAAAADSPASGAETLQLNAAAELPQPPMHSHVTQVVEGTVDLAKGTGVLTSRVLAGHRPYLGMALPGLTRVIKITSASQVGRRVRLTGRIEDSAALERGENAAVNIVIDKATGVVRAPFIGNPVDHRLT